MKNIEKHLNSGKVNVAFKNETGNRYGNLLVVDYFGAKGRCAHWICKCDCGETLSVSGYRLRDGSRDKCDKNCQFGSTPAISFQVSEWATKSILRNAA